MLKKIFSLTAAALLLFACTDDEWPAQPDWSQIPNPDEEVDDGLLKPAACTNNIVAHRGGATECKAPDNSLASLRYAIGQGCYGSECDIYWTKDDNVVVAHADGQCRINGMHPWEHTLAELRAGGGLSNGEQLPSLEDFLGEVMKEGCPTRLWLDIKNITYPSTLTEYAINAARRSCEIATEMGAKHFVEFICTGNTTVMKSAFAYAGAAGIPIGWMSNRPAGEYVGLGYSWANLSAASYMSAEAGGKGTRTLEEFEKEGVALSVFNVDRQAGDGNAVYTTEAVDYYCSAAGRFKALCTNYPAWLIEKVEAAAKVYDGIRSEADLRAFAAEVAVDPTAKRFQNAAGEVVLHTDIAVSEAWTPIAGFAGVLDGNGKTLTVNYSGSDEQAGIFATLDGTVKNLRVAGSFTTTATAKVTLGAVAGKLGEKAQIVGCT
nr:glycerophosphodiester phosphodiesterase [Alistipes sp.]